VGTTYKQAGVDIEAGDASWRRIKPYAARTMRPEVVAGVGGFGGLFALPPGQVPGAVLVAGTDGVGTKLKVAFQAGRHGTVGIDLVAMSVKRHPHLWGRAALLPGLLRHGAAGGGRRRPRWSKGIALGCEQAGCTLLGGETAEMPGFYARGEYDLAGFCVGVVERSDIIDGAGWRPGTRSSACPPRAALQRLLAGAQGAAGGREAGAGRGARGPGTGRWRTRCWSPTRIYVKDALALMKAVKVKGFAHITGSGLPGNLPRCLPDGTRAVLEEKAWKRPPIFELIQRLGRVERKEMYDTFNMGLGLIAVVAKEDVATALATLKARGVEASEVGRVEAGQGEATAVIEP
jgi:phosphoribosylformylglycinamidine cyclo-ligase